MQVEPRYRKSIKKWVVDTRAKGIKKLNGGVGEQKEFVCKEAADAYCVRINQQQASGGAVSQHTAGTLRQAYEFFQTEIDMNIGDVWTYHYGAGLKTDLGHYCDLVLDGEAMPFGEFKCVDITPANVQRNSSSVTEICLTKHAKKRRKHFEHFSIMHELIWSGAIIIQQPGSN